MRCSICAKAYSKAAAHSTTASSGSTFHNSKMVHLVLWQGWLVAHVAAVQWLPAERDGDHTYAARGFKPAAAAAVAAAAAAMWQRQKNWSERAYVQHAIRIFAERDGDHTHAARGFKPAEAAAAAMWQRQRILVGACICSTCHSNLC
jgi:hypothetical protein